MSYPLHDNSNIVKIYKIEKINILWIELNLCQQVVSTRVLWHVKCHQQLTSSLNNAGEIVYKITVQKMPSGGFLNLTYWILSLQYPNNKFDEIRPNSLRISPVFSEGG